MNIEDRTELAWIAMDGIHDMDTGLTDYAKAAAKGLGWIDLAKDKPELDDVVVCTNGKARWLDKRMDGFEGIHMLKWNGHTATHWHPIADLPALAPAERGAPEKTGDGQ